LGGVQARGALGLPQALGMQGECMGGPTGGLHALHVALHGCMPPHPPHPPLPKP
jgi:hypothetical protein